jgi:orotidine-5'-phosphate decarboxylase
MQFACSNPRIATTVFSTTRPDAIKTNLAYIAEPMDEQLVQEVQEIIGDQQRVTTPAKAREIGSDYIVVGRSITAAERPIDAYTRCREEFL